MGVCLVTGGYCHYSGICGFSAVYEFTTIVAYAGLRAVSELILLCTLSNTWICPIINNVYSNTWINQLAIIYTFFGHDVRYTNPMIIINMQNLNR